jgi:Flp pilus assembly protein TadG
MDRSECASRLRRNSSRGWRGESGAALLEFTLVFALFVFVHYALIAFGMMLAVKQSITQAAADGARAAIGVPPDQREAKARERVGKGLDWLGSKYQPSDTAVTEAPCDAADAAGPQCITVTITYPYENRPIVPPAPGLGLVTPKSFKTTSVVQVASAP